MPTIVNGESVIPYQGLRKHRPVGRKYAPPIATCIDYPDDGNKVVSSLAEALKRCGLKDGMTISTHHHLRDGDLVSNTIFDVAHEAGVRDLVWAPTASFPCNDPLIKYLEDGTSTALRFNERAIGKIYFLWRNEGCAVLRSHGGRVQHTRRRTPRLIFVVIAAPTADPFGNATGV